MDVSIFTTHGASPRIADDINVLLYSLPKNIKVPRADEMSDLTWFATAGRYEEGAAEFTPEELDGAIRLAEETIQWAGRIIKRK